MGVLAALVGYNTFKKEKKLKEGGIKTTALVVDFSDEEMSDGPTVKVPVFEFYDNLNNKFRVKGVSNSICKIGETTVIYYNPVNPKTEYYFPNKDFLVKYLFSCVGLFMLIAGLVCLYKDFIKFNSGSI
ncbi:hypothetical protein EV143_11168 [Flavobacterium chryseum]|nr:hypothetical protein EV143_11168 [Flavobacterium sp. P3160]